MQEQSQKPLSELTNKEWRGTIIAITFIGIFIALFGLKDMNWSLIKIGLILAAIGIIGGLILHYFFGIKIIQLRNDIKHPKYK